jgi:hypothetical protein
MDEPIRDCPRIDIDDDIREKLRKEMLLPKLTKSNTETADPNLAKDRTDKLLPRCKKSITEAL